jgi:hypothetical protein
MRAAAPTDWAISARPTHDFGAADRAIGVATLYIRPRLRR